MGRRTAVTNAGRTATTYAYDAAGELTTVARGAVSQLDRLRRQRPHHVA